jgi:predicted ferric reductase
VSSNAGISTVAWTIHLVIGVVAAIGFFRFWVRTRFWFPRYVHVLAALALLIGLWLVTIIPPDAPINKGDYRTLKNALVVVGLPALVYLVFVFYGGQHAAYESRRRDHAVRCPYCASADVLAGNACPVCGQIH